MDCSTTGIKAVLLPYGFHKLSLFHYSSFDLNKAGSRQVIDGHFHFDMAQLYLQTNGITQFFRSKTLVRSRISTINNLVA